MPEEIIQDYLSLFVLYFPIGAIGLWRWSVWSVKKTLSARYKPGKAGKYSVGLSVITPVYNEDPKLFRRALVSWAHESPEEIIAVIDYTDKKCIAVFRRFKKEYSSARLIITGRPGKREALSDGIASAKTEIVALVDSDTVWGPGLKNLVLPHFKNPRVGGVGTRQNVIRPDTLARRLFDIHLDQRYFDEIPFLAATGNALTCVSGRTAFYRLAAVRGLRNELENETFMGKKCISGDDKCLTRLVQAGAWQVRFEAAARVYTPGARTLATLIKQYIRWTRNSYRSDLKSLFSGWLWKREKVLGLYMLDRMVQPFTLILSPIYFVFSIYWEHYLISAILFAWWHLSRGVKLQAHLYRRPRDILIIPAYIAVSFLMAVFKIYAMITIGRQGWITRWDKHRLSADIYKKFISAGSYLSTAVVLLFLASLVSATNSNVFIEKPAITEVNTAAEAKYADKRVFENKAGALVNPEKKAPVEKADPAPAEKCSSLNLSFSGKNCYYRVRRGDNLWRISQKYEYELTALIRANKYIADPNLIFSGQRLIMPGILERQLK